MTLLQNIQTLISKNKMNKWSLGYGQLIDVMAVLNSEQFPYNITILRGICSALLNLTELSNAEAYLRTLERDVLTSVGIVIVMVMAVLLKYSEGTLSV